MQRCGFFWALSLTAGGILAAALLAPGIAGGGVSRRCSARKRINPSLTQKGQAQQEKSDDEETPHGASSRLFTSLWIDAQAVGVGGEKLLSGHHTSRARNSRMEEESHRGHFPNRNVEAVGH